MCPERTFIPLALVAALVSSHSVSAAESLWTIAIFGGREITTTVRQASSDVPMANVALLARDLDLVVEQHDDRAVIHTASGAEWRTANGSVLLEGPLGTRSLAAAAVITGAAVYLPLDSIAYLAGRKLVVDRSRALLLPAGASRSSDERAPAGWERLQIKKTEAELAEMRRLDGQQLGDDDRPSLKDVLPPAHESLSVDVGLGVAQGFSGAADVAASGTAAGVRIAFNAFLTYGRDGAIVRSGRLTLDDPRNGWWLEAGDLLSEVRGLARGVRVGRAIRPWWRPSVAMYVRSPTLSPLDRSVVAYRDDLQLPLNVGLHVEAVSDRSSLVGVRWLQGRASIETFVRDSSSRNAHDRGATASYDIWHGITVQLGARLSTGAAAQTGAPTAQTGTLGERWYFGGLSVPVGNLATVTVERTRSALNASDTNAFGLRLPIGRVSVMQRYQWTDVAFVTDPVLNAAGHRQLQSIASYSPVRRVQLSYQVATHWTANAEARQTTELQTVFSVSRATSLHAVTGFPDVRNPERFRFGLQQNLAHGFRLAVDYGRLPAFQSAAQDTVDHARFLVMVRRTFAAKTPTRGSDVRGRVLDERGDPVAGAAVTLGSYVTTSTGDGSYRFPHVPAGERDLALDRAHLPAQYSPDGVRQHLRLSGAGVSDVDLHVVPLHAIHGHVYIDRNGNGQFDFGEGVPNVVVRSGTQSATTTDEEGAYGFYNLPPSHHRIWVDADRLSRDLTIASEGVAEIDLDAEGRSRTGVDFRVVPKQKPIVFQKSLPQ